MTTRGSTTTTQAPSRASGWRLVAAGLGAVCIVGALAFSTLRPAAPVPVVDAETTDDTVGGKSSATKSPRKVAETGQRRQPKSHRLPFPSQFGV